VYVVPEPSPVSEYVVMVPVFVMVVQVEPALVDLSILYPVIIVPPLLVGALHFRFICVDDADTVSPVGEFGLVALGCIAAAVLLGEEPEPVDTVLLAGPPPEVNVLKCCNENVNLDRCCDCIIISHWDELIELEDTSLTPSDVHESSISV